MCPLDRRRGVSGRTQPHRHFGAVWLCAELDLLWDRVRHKETRPLLRTADPKRTLAELCEKREPFYAMADLKVHTLPHYSIDETSDKVIEALLRRPDILEGA